MNILSLDCAGKILTVTLTAGGKLYFANSGEAGSKKHNSLILPFADELLTKAGIGVSTAHALARATGAKLISVNTLQARGFGIKGDFAVALQCRPTESYAATFKGDCFNMTSCKASGEDEIAALNMRVIRHEGSLTAENLADFARALAEKGQFAASLSPLYLKKSQAERLAGGE